MEQKQESLPIPCTPIFDTLSRTVELGNNQPGRIAEFLEEYAAKHPHKSTPKPRELTLDIRQTKSGKLEYRFKTEGIAIGVCFNGIEKLNGDNGVAAKMLQLIMAKGIQQAYRLKDNPLRDSATGKLRTSTPPDQPIILTPLELQALGIFASQDSARAHTMEILDKLSLIKLRTSSPDREEYVPLFTKYGVEKPNQHWQVYLNPEVKFWSWLIHYYCRFPIKGFQLSGKAFALLRYTMLLANLNGGKINKQGYFVLTVDSLIERLRLNRNDKHKKDALLKPIIKALREINTTENIDVRAEFDTLDENTTVLLNDVLSLPPETLDTEINKMLSDKALKVPVALEGRVKIYVQPTLLRKWALPKNNTKALPRKEEK